MRLAATFLALLLVTLGALASTGRTPPAAEVRVASTQAETDARPWSGPRHVAADDGAASQSGLVIEACEVPVDSDGRFEMMLVDATDLRLSARPYAWPVAVVPRAPSPWLASPLRPPRPLDA